MTLLFDDSPENEHGLTWSGLGSGISAFCRDLWQVQSNFWGGTVVSVVRMLSQTVGVLAQEGVSRLSTKLSALQPKRKGARAGSANAKVAVLPVLFRTSNRMSVYKVHGALGERWTKPADSRPIRLSRGKQNPWVAAEIKNTAVVARIPKTEESEIRGLDDIFTVPVQGSFLDVLHPAERPEGRRKRHGVKPAITPIQSDWDLKEPPEPTVIQEIDRMTTLAEKQQRLKVETRKLSKRVKRVADSTQDWFSRQEATFADVAAQLSEKVPAPYQSYVTEGEVIFAPVPPPLQVVKTEESGVVTRPSPAWQQASVQVSSIPLEIPAALPKGEFNGFDYMVQNNRILARSISNLVDRYFDQNALSEDSA